jgi:hypothetical protein
MNVTTGADFSAFSSTRSPLDSSLYSAKPPSVRTCAKPSAFTASCAAAVEKTNAERRTGSLMRAEKSEAPRGTHAPKTTSALSFQISTLSDRLHGDGEHG